jgi:hypothetical protein
MQAPLASMPISRAGSVSGVTAFFPRMADYSASGMDDGWY